MSAAPIYPPVTLRHLQKLKEALHGPMNKAEMARKVKDVLARTMH